MKTIFYNCFMLFLALFISSCAGFWYGIYDCKVESYGNHPQTKTYYLLPEDSVLIDNLECIEYANLIRKTLNEIGYTETSSEYAEVCIKFSYFEGERQYEGTSTYGSSNTINIVNGKVVQNGYGSANVKNNYLNNTSNSNATISSNTKLKGTNKTYTSTYSTTSEQYSVPIACKITAYSTTDKRIIWTTHISDKYDYNEPRYSLRKFMPWMLLLAQPYIGTNAEITPSINVSDGRKKGLIPVYEDLVK